APRCTPPPPPCLLPALRRSAPSCSRAPTSPAERDNARMFHIVLVEPEIPPNTGNVIRLAANTGCSLHLVEPLGFSLDDKQLRRAGLDYHEYAQVRSYANWQALLASQQPDPERMFAFTTRAIRNLHAVALRAGDWLVFGAETRG